MGGKIRIGAVSYLNTRPLVYGLEQGLGADRISLSFEVPSALADRMAAGELDIALLPVIELARIPGLEIVPGLGIVTRGTSRSVLLVSRVPVEEVRRVALDPESRTTNALVQVLFDEGLGAHPEFVPGDPRLEQALEECDAAVRIGDKALFEPSGEDRFEYDLAQIWSRQTGLPFVFAVWAARPGVVDRGIYRTLHDSRRRGGRALDAIAADYRWRGEPRTERALAYLQRHIHFRLGRPEVDAMKRFFRSAARLGLIESEPPLRLALQRWTTCHDVAAQATGAAETTRGE